MGAAGLVPVSPSWLLSPGGAPGTAASFWHDVPSLAMPPPAWLLTGAVPVSLLSAGHTDDFQRGQGAGAAFQAEGEAWGTGVLGCWGTEVLGCSLF